MGPRLSNALRPSLLTCIVPVCDGQGAPRAGEGLLLGRHGRPPHFEEGAPHLGQWRARQVPGTGRARQRGVWGLVLPVLHEHGEGTGVGLSVCWSEGREVPVV